MARLNGKDRGLFFVHHPRGIGQGPRREAGMWGVEYYDHAGQRHRVRVGSKTDALAFRDVRKAEKLHRKRFPEQYFEPVRLADLIADHVTAKQASQQKTAPQIEHRPAQVLTFLGNVDATAIPDQIIE